MVLHINYPRANMGSVKGIHNRYREGGRGSYRGDPDGAYINGLMDSRPILLTLFLAHFHLTTGHHHNLARGGGEERSDN